MDKERRNKSVDEDDYESLNQHHGQRSENRKGLFLFKLDTNGERNISGAWKLAVIVLGIIGVILLVVGLCLYCNSVETVGNDKEIDYTNCTDGSPANKPCKERVQLGKPCICRLHFELKEPIQGQTFLYYITPDIRTSQNYKDSRDDNQLAGTIGTPSASCGDFAKDETGKPIVPCGEIADSYLEDVYDVYEKTYLPYTDVGLYGITEEDKEKYHNPIGNLEDVYKDFAKPKNWTKNIWELDKKNPENNGLQNERFIGWMKPDLTRKPALRFNHTDKYKEGIPVGNYTFSIEYKPSSYVNQRIIGLSSKHESIIESYLNAGIALIVVGVILLVGSLFGVAFLYVLRIKDYSF